MKKLIYSLTILFALFVTSCGISVPLATNHNLHNTEVVLSKNNFKVVKSVSASETATYWFGVGGLKKQALLGNARAKMIQEAGLEGSSKAIINENVEMHVKQIFFLVKYTVIVSGQVVEFNGN